jgi:hypothetical protein
MFRIGVSVRVFLLLASCVLPLAAQQSGAGVAATTYYACVNNTTGAVRIVTSTTTCNPTEHRIAWNQAGPQGPAGAQGPTGLQGPPGTLVGYSSLLDYGIFPELSRAPGVLVAETAPVATTGTYYITASAFLSVDPNDGVAWCYDTTPFTGYIRSTGGGTAYYSQASITDALIVNAGDSVQLWCYSGEGDGFSFVLNAGLTATLIDSSSAPSKPLEFPHRRPGPSLPKR